MSRSVRLMIVPLIFLFIGLVVLKLLSFTGHAPVRDKSLPALPGCPASPNCVCSQNSDESHSVAPIPLSGDLDRAWQTFQGIVTNVGGKLAVAVGDHYARYEFRSRVFGYVDDFECLLNREQKRIEIRSASRSGYSDLGVNRKRVELIRQEFEKQSPGVTSPE